MTGKSSGVVVELFEGGWLEPCRGLSPVRVIVARHAAPPKGEGYSSRQAYRGVGLRTVHHNAWRRGVPGRGCAGSLSWAWGRSSRCWPMKMSKKIPIAGVPPPSVGKSCGKWRVNGCGTRLLCLGQTMQAVQVREIE